MYKRQREDTGAAEIPLADVVPGDLIELAAGDIIPADLRIDVYKRQGFGLVGALTLDRRLALIALQRAQDRLRRQGSVGSDLLGLMYSLVRSLIRLSP